MRCTFCSHHTRGSCFLCQRGPLGSEELAKEFGASFIREELKTRESLLWQPRLTDSDLKDTLGVNALGKRRLLLAMLEQLWAEADAETAVAARASIA